MSDDEVSSELMNIDPYGNIWLTRLNYEWRQIIDIIKHIDSSESTSLWDQIYGNIQEYIGQFLETEVHISSEYMIFDNCIRQAIPWFIVAYNDIVDSYKQILDISAFLPFEYLKEKIYAHNDIEYFDMKLSEIDRYLNLPNFKLCVDNLIIMGDLEIDENIINEIQLYVEALYTHRLHIPNADYKSEITVDHIVQCVIETLKK